MITTINTASQFRDAFINAGRKEQFSYDALGMLFDYFEDIDPSMELDVIAICCEYQESSIDDYSRDYGLRLAQMDEDARLAAVVEHINDNSSLVGITNYGNVIYEQF